METNIQGTDTMTRQSWLDFAKGLGIIFVMIGHSTLYTGMMLVYIFHIPMFFFLSGYVYSGERYPNGGFIKQKVKRLLIPYYVLGIPMLIACTIQDAANIGFRMQYLNQAAQWQRVFQYLIQDRFGTLWYISCLFWLNCIFYLLMKLCRHKLKRMLIAALVMLAIAIVYYSLGGGSLPGNIDVCFTVMPFFLAGFAAKQKGIFESGRLAERPMRWFWILILASLIIGTVNFAIVGKKIDIYYNDYGVWPLMYAGAFAGIFAIICLSKKVKNRVIEYVGRNSILFYAWHQAMIFPLVQGILYQLRILQGMSIGARVGNSLLCIAASLLILWIPTHFLKKTKAGEWFGVR